MDGWGCAIELGELWLESLLDYFLEDEGVTLWGLVGGGEARHLLCRVRRGGLRVLRAAHGDHVNEEGRGDGDGYGGGGERRGD